MKKLFLQTRGWLLFQECDTCFSGAGRRIASVLICFLTLLITLKIAHAEIVYAVIEGEGIENVGKIGDDVRAIENVFGKANRIVKEDMYITDLFYEYHKPGMLVTTDKFKKIKGITLYTNTGDIEQFHKTGLTRINSSSMMR